MMEQLISKAHCDYDPRFVQQVTGLFINNIAELRDSLTHAIKTDDPASFLQKLHKAKTALTLISNETLLKKAEQIRHELNQKPVSAIDCRLLNSFRKNCSQEIERLSAKLKLYESIAA
jgi:HPt (histidine-containing phosphotransfer) domain-containing protein